MASEFKENAEDLNTADSVQVDVNAIQARLDAASTGMSFEVRVGANTLRATADTEDRPGFVEGMAGLVEAVTGATGPLTITLADDEDGQDATFALHAYSDLRRLLDENARLNAELAAAANTITAPAVQLAEIGAMVGYPDPSGIADAVRASLAARDATITALSERCTAKGLELDRVIRDAAALAAKIGEGSEEWAIRVITQPGGTYWYHNESDGENPEQDLALTLKVLADGRDIEGNPVPHGPVSIVKRTVWSTEWQTVAPEMPRPPAEEGCTCHLTDPSTWTTYGSAVEPGSMYEPDPDCPEHGAHTEILTAQEAHSGPETPGTGSGRGTGVAEAENSAQASAPWIPSFYGSECPHRPEWTCPKHDECRACECDCNTYVADLEEPDLTLIPGDMVVRDPEVCSGRPTMRGTRILASRIAGELAAGTSWETLREWYPSLPSLPVPSTEEARDEH